MKPRLRWYALRVSPTALPVVFDTYDAAKENAEVDEAVYEVKILTLRCVKKAQRRQPKSPVREEKNDARVDGQS